jgi:DNA-nicking Smr family endonuclease
MTIDLHGLKHHQSIPLVEEFVLKNSVKEDLTELTIVTGKSSSLQNKITQQVLDRHGFQWYIPEWNRGQITVITKGKI